MSMAWIFFSVTNRSRLVMPAPTAASVIARSGDSSRIQITLIASDCPMKMTSAVMAVLADWKNIRLSWMKKLELMLVHPFFYMEYILIVGRAVLGVNPKGWEKIGRVQY